MKEERFLAWIQRDLNEEPDSSSFSSAFRCADGAHNTKDRFWKWASSSLMCSHALFSSGSVCNRVVYGEAEASLQQLLTSESDVVNEHSRPRISELRPKRGPLQSPFLSATYSNDSDTDSVREDSIQQLYEKENSRRPIAWFQVPICAISRCSGGYGVYFKYLSLTSILNLFILPFAMYLMLDVYSSSIESGSAQKDYWLFPNYSSRKTNQTIKIGMIPGEAYIFNAPSWFAIVDTLLNALIIGCYSFLPVARFYGKNEIPEAADYTVVLRGKQLHTLSLSEIAKAMEAQWGEVFLVTSPKVCENNLVFVMFVNEESARQCKLYAFSRRARSVQMRINRNVDVSISSPLAGFEINWHNLNRSVKEQFVRGSFYCFFIVLIALVSQMVFDYGETIQTREAREHEGASNVISSALVGGFVSLVAQAILYCSIFLIKHLHLWSKWKEELLSLYAMTTVRMALLAAVVNSIAGETMMGGSFGLLFPPVKSDRIEQVLVFSLLADVLFADLCPLLFALCRKSLGRLILMHTRWTALGETLRRLTRMEMAKRFSSSYAIVAFSFPFWNLFPILIPISLLVLVLRYGFDKRAVALACRQPPSRDHISLFNLSFICALMALKYSASFPLFISTQWYLRSWGSIFVFFFFFSGFIAIFELFPIGYPWKLRENEVPCYSVRDLYSFAGYGVRLDVLSDRHANEGAATVEEDYGQWSRYWMRGRGDLTLNTVPLSAPRPVKQRPLNLIGAFGFEKASIHIVL